MNQSHFLSTIRQKHILQNVDFFDNCWRQSLNLRKYNLSNKKKKNLNNQFLFLFIKFDKNAVDWLTKNLKRKSEDYIDNRFIGLEQHNV